MSEEIRSKVQCEDQVQGPVWFQVGLRSVLIRKQGELLRNLKMD